MRYKLDFLHVAMPFSLYPHEKLLCHVMQQGMGRLSRQSYPLYRIHTYLVAHTRTIVLVGVPLSTWICSALLPCKMNIINACKIYLSSHQDHCACGSTTFHLDLFGTPPTQNEHNQCLQDILGLLQSPQK
jgi:hypothetical protein